MRLKILPPTLRERKRYVVFEVISQVPLNREDIISLIWKASLDLFGEYGTSKLNLWIMEVYQHELPDYENVLRGILQCNHREVKKIRAALSVITKFNGARVVFHTLGISGTIRSATKKFIKAKK